jgi:hypothetical protein
MSSATAGKVRKREARTAGRVISAFVIMALVFSGSYYLLLLVVTGDPLWFRTDFDAQPQRLVVQNRGVRIDIPQTDPRFAPLVDAFNRSIEQGYFDASLGFGDPTWQLSEETGLIVETQYDTPVRLHGRFVPTRRLRILISGERIHTTELLFRSNEVEWDRIPHRLKDVSLLAQALKQFGFGE